MQPRTLNYAVLPKPRPRFFAFWGVYLLCCISGLVIARIIDHARPKLLGKESWEDGMGAVTIAEILISVLLLVIRISLGQTRLSRRVAIFFGLFPSIVLFVAFVLQSIH